MVVQNKTKKSNRIMGLTLPSIEFSASPVPALELVSDSNAPFYPLLSLFSDNSLLPLAEYFLWHQGVSLLSIGSSSKQYLFLSSV
ncbi:hypothetical protein NW752_001987 [Fusarium irregulare]|nr:hypothetical protein NW752_001987 [Fusarium irregulare]